MKWGELKKLAEESLISDETELDLFMDEDTTLNTVLVNHYNPDTNTWTFA